MTLKQAMQTNKKFLALVEERNGEGDAMKSLDKVLESPIDFVVELRAAIAAAQDNDVWTSKEAKIWTGISRNLQPVCREEEKEATRRSQENKLFQLELRILDLDEKISRPGRCLVAQESLQVSSSVRSFATSPTSSLRQHAPSKIKWTDMEVILTNDTILYLKKSKRHKGMFDFKAQFGLTQILAAEHISGSNDLKLMIGDTIYILRFELLSDAEKWLAEMRQHITSRSNSKVSRDHAPRAGFDRSSPPTASAASASSAVSHGSPPPAHNNASARFESYLTDRESEVKNASDLDDVDVKKRKKRSTSNAGGGGDEITAVKERNVSAATSVKLGIHDNTSHSTTSSNKPRTSTDSKRSKFTKSLSVSTISPQIVPSRMPPRHKMLTKQKTTESPSHDFDHRSSEAGEPNRTISNSNSAGEISSKEKRRKSGKSVDFSSAVQSANNASTTTSSTTTTTTSSSGPVPLVSSIDFSKASNPSPAATSGSTSPSSGKSSSSPASNSNKETSAPTAATGAAPTASGVSLPPLPSVPESPAAGSTTNTTTTNTTTSSKYLLRPPRVADRLEGSSDYEESEDVEYDPNRLLADPKFSSIVRPGLRDLSVARKLQSSSVRELRSGSIDDLSARDHPPRIAPSLSGVPQEPEESGAIANPTCHGELPIPLIVSTIARMESDLALLKKLLSDRGIHM